MNKLHNYIVNKLPHGSGIDYKWKSNLDIIDLSELLAGNTVRVEFYNSYHCMNQSGMYSGIIDFTAILSIRFNYQSGSIEIELEEVEADEDTIRSILTDYEVFYCEHCDNEQEVDYNLIVYRCNNCDTESNENSEGTTCYNCHRGVV